MSANHPFSDIRIRDEKERGGDPLVPVAQPMPNEPL